MKGILLLNIGTPKSTQPVDVRRFIGDMLSDPLLLSDVPTWFRSLLAKYIIAPIRAGKSSEKYKLIWNFEEDISPITCHTENLCKKMEERCGCPVTYAFRYGNPDVSTGLQRLEEKSAGLHEVTVIPMTPQYAQSSYQTIIDEVGKHFYQNPHNYKLKIVEPYYNNQGYIKALCERLKPYISQPYDKLIFTFHSLPLSHIEQGWHKGKDFDYLYHIKETLRLISHELKLNIKKNRLVYSSAIGSKWLKPDMLSTVQEIAQEEKGRLVIFAPGFTADNIETLYDINIAARRVFLNSGGKEFVFVPCLNSEDYWVDGLIKVMGSV